MPSLTALRHRELILVLYDLDYRYERNGEEVCEGHGFSFAECWAIPCCHWNDGECWSSVGQDQCQGKKTTYKIPYILYYRIVRMLPVASYHDLTFCDIISHQKQYH